MLNATMIHPVFVHFTVALFFLSVCFDLVGLIKKDVLFHKLAWINLIASGIATVFTVASGLLTKNNLNIAETAQSTLDLHQTLAFLITTCILSLIFWRIGLKGKFPYNNILLYLIVSIAGLIVLIIGTYYGHKLVYQHGIGVQKQSNLPHSNSNYENRVVLKHNDQIKIFRRYS